MRSRFLIACMTLLAATAAAAAQTPDRARIIAAAREVMTHARYATLTTIDAAGHPAARIVDPVAPDAGLTVWIGTNAKTRKVAEIGRDGHVALTYFDATALEYVTLLGVATVVTDRQEQARHWKAEWQPFYKEGARDPTFTIIRVRPTRVEIVSPGRKLVNDSVTWRPVGVNFP